MASRIEDYGMIGNTRPRRWSRAAAPSTGSARRASTPPPASPRCSVTTITAAGRSPAGGSGDAAALSRRHAWCSRPSSTARRRVRVIDFMPIRDGRCNSPASSKASAARCRSDAPHVRFDYGADIPLGRDDSRRARFIGRSRRTVLHTPLDAPRRAGAARYLRSCRSGTANESGSARLVPVARPDARGPGRLGGPAAPIRSGGAGRETATTRALAGGCGALADDTQGADVCAHGGYRCRADHVAARGSAASATGTTGSAGSATPLYPVRAACSAATGRSARFRDWLCAPSPAIPADLQIMYGLGASVA